MPKIYNFSIIIDWLIQLSKLFSKTVYNVWSSVSVTVLGSIWMQSLKIPTNCGLNWIEVYFFLLLKKSEHGLSSTGVIYHNVQDPDSSILMVCPAQILIPNCFHDSRWLSELQMFYSVGRRKGQWKMQMHFFPVRTLFGS